MNERDIFLQALDIDSAEGRHEFLDTSCGDDTELRLRVEDLLRSHDEASGFLETPAMEPAATLAASPSEAGASDFERERTELYEPVLGGNAVDFLEPADDPELLGRLGPYDVHEVVGRGGMGVVLKAHDPLLDRVVAIKTLSPEYAGNPTARKRFARESQAAAAVAHPHVVTIHGVEPNGPVPYLVMELVRGQSLRQKLDATGALELREILRIGSQIAQGLAAAHGQGLIHRDVKPGNVLLENGVERVKLTDFGLARATDDVAITRTGDISGTPQYMSPEQAEGRAVDHRSDLFSLGSVLYAMCTGRPPFRGDTTVGVLRRVCDDTPRPIREVNPDVPEWLVDIVDHLLAKDPEHRFQSADEVARVLGEHLAELQNPSSSSRTPKYERRLPPAPRTAARWMTAALAIGVVVGTVGLTEATGVTKFSPTIVRLFTGSGTLVVEVDDPEVSVSIEGQELVITGAGAQEIRVKPGEHTVVATKNGKPISREIVRVERGGRQIVRVTRESAPDPELVDEHDDGDPRKVIVSIRQGENGPEFELDGRTVPAGGLEEQLRELLTNDNDQRFSVELQTDADVRMTQADRDALVRKLKQTLGGRLVPGLVVGNPRLAARLAERKLNLKRIGLAQHNHHDALRSFAPDGRNAAHFDDEGRPHLSWRVHVLPYLGEEDLYQRFRLDEPWDSDHNRALLTEMPGVYKTTDEESQTTFVMVVGEGTAYEGKAGFRLRDILDGTAKTALVVDAGPARSVPWTKPVDLPFDAEDPIRAFGESEFADGFPVAMCDGRVLQISYDTAPESLRALFTRSGRDRFDEDAVRSDSRPSARKVALAAPAEVRRLEGHSYKVVEVRYLPDGRHAVSSSSDKTARVWDTATGREVRRFEEHESSVFALDVSADGRLVATGDDDGCVLVWERETGRTILRWEDYGERVMALAFSNDGRRLAVGGRSTGEVVLLQIHDGKFVWRTTVSKTSINDLEFSPDGHRLAAVTNDAQLVQIEAATGARIADVEPTAGSLVRVAFSPDNRLVAVRNRHGEIHVFDRRERRLLRRFDTAGGGGWGLAFARNGGLLVTGSQKVLQVWAVDTGAELARAVVDTNCVQHLDVSPDGQFVLTGGGEYTTTREDGSKWYRGDGDYALRLWELPDPVADEHTDVETPAAPRRGEQVRFDEVVEMVDRWIDGLEHPDWVRTKPLGDFRDGDGQRLGDLRRLDPSSRILIARRFAERVQESKPVESRIRQVLSDLGSPARDEATPQQLVLSLLTRAAELDPPQRVTEETANARTEAMRRGITFLRENQERDGSWRFGPDASKDHYVRGQTALVALALLRAGVPADDPVVARAVAYVDRETSTFVYEVATQTALLCEVDPDKYAAKIAANVRALTASQSTTGDAAGTWRYETKPEADGNGDLSNTSYAVWALHTAATRAKVRVDPAVWTRLREYLLRAQTKDGAWTYVAKIPKGTGSMTAGGLFCLVAARTHAPDSDEDDGDTNDDGTKKSEDRAWVWLAEQVGTPNRIGRNPGSTTWHLYWLDQLRRAGDLAERPRLGDVDWRSAGRSFLLATQGRNGSWTDGSGTPLPHVSTAFALMFLAEE